MKYLIFFIATSLFAVTNIPITIIGVTNTQAIIQYTAPDTNPCTVTAAPVNTALLPEVYDLDSALFTNADQDNKTGDIASGLQRTVVIGHRTSGIALDGTSYSLALAVVSAYTGGVSCDSGSFTGTFSFVTDNLRIGNASPDPPDYDTTNTNLFGWDYPTLHYDTLTPTYIDPHTGVIIKRVSGAGEDSAGKNTQCFTNIEDLASAWTSVGNIACTADGSYATYAGAAGPAAALFFWAASPMSSGINGVARPSWLPNSWVVPDDDQLSVTGHSSTGAASANVCNTYDHGATCVGPTLTTLLGTSDTTILMPTASTYPQAYFHDWSDAPVRMDMITNRWTGTVNTSGHTVTWVSNVDPGGSGYNVYFPVTVLKAGMKILMPSQSANCTLNECTIATVTNERSLTTVEALTTGTGVAYSFPNWGFKFWKTGTGTISIDAVTSNYANSGSFFTGFEGGGPPFCSTATTTVSWKADGTPLSPSQQGYTCTIQSSSGNYHYFLFVPSTGEARWISALTGLAAELNILNPLQLFALNTSTNYLQQCLYDPSVGHWQSPSLYSSALNPNISCSNINPTATGNDVQSEIQAARPDIDQSYFGGPSLQTTAATVNCPGGLTVSPCLFNIQETPQQGALSWFCNIDVALTPGAAQVVNCHNSWDTYPVRWVSIHGKEQFDGSSNYTSLGVGTELNDVTKKGIGLFQLAITTIYNNGGVTSLNNTFVDPSGSCQSLVTTAGGGTIPSTLASQIPTISGVGGASLDCIRMNVPNEPANITPLSSELTPLGGLPVGARPTACTFNASWSCLQTMQPGDFLQDHAETDAGEKFLILYKAAVGSTWDLVLARGLNPWFCRTFPALFLYTSHLANWKPFEYPPNSCATLNFVIPNSSSTSLAILDNPSLGTGHVGGKSTTAGLNYQYVPYDQNPPVDLGGFGSNYGVRVGVFPTVVGKGINYGTNMNPGFASPGHPMDFSQAFYCCIQSHPAGGNYAAPLTEQVWGVDGRALGGTGGGTAYEWTQVATLVAGQTATYKVTQPTDTSHVPLQYSAKPWFDVLMRKLHGQMAFSGYHLVRDISGPGSSISDATPWTYCVADVAAGECVAGSAIGDMFESIPEATTSGNCTLEGTIYNFCVSSTPALAGMFDQYDITQRDDYGLRTRILTSIFNGPGRTDNYANIHTLATGDWLFGTSHWGDFKRTDMFAVRSPPWPTADTVNRNQPVLVTVQIPGGVGVTARARFGYNTSLFCGTRAEVCTTAIPTGNTSPFMWASETQQFQACTTGCKINIPAYSGRVLYYAIDTQIGGVTTSGAIMPPVAVN